MRALYPEPPGAGFGRATFWVCRGFRVLGFRVLGQGIARLTATALGQTTTAPARPMAAEHTWERQCELAEAQWQRHHGKDVVVRRSRVGTGMGLYAVRDLPVGWELFYCGRYYASWAHLVDAGRDTGQYTIAEGHNRPHFDGEPIEHNLAKFAGGMT
jgi:hypothetical protein